MDAVDEDKIINELNGVLSNCPFIDIKNHWAEDIIINAYSRGLISGREYNKFYPNEPITRAEAVALIMKIVK